MRDDVKLTCRHVTRLLSHRKTELTTAVNCYGNQTINQFSPVVSLEILYNFVLFLILFESAYAQYCQAYMFIVVFSRVLKRNDTAVISDCWVLWRTRIIAPLPEIKNALNYSRPRKSPSKLHRKCRDYSGKATTSGRETYVELTPSKHKKTLQLL